MKKGLKILLSVSAVIIVSILVFSANKTPFSASKTPYEIICQSKYNPEYLVPEKFVDQWEEQKNVWLVIYQSKAKNFVIRVLRKDAFGYQIKGAFNWYEKPTNNLPVSSCYTSIAHKNRFIHNLATNIRPYAVFSAIYDKSIVKAYYNDKEMTIYEFNNNRIAYLIETDETDTQDFDFEFTDAKGNTVYKTNG